MTQEEIFKSHMDKFRTGLFRASLDHYLETGAISGSLLLEVREMLSRERVEALESDLKLINECWQADIKQIASLESKLSTLEETLKAADEVIKYGIPEGMYEHFELEKALEKYNSLKQKV